MGYKPFPQPSGISHRPTPTRLGSSSGPAPIAVFANGSAAPTTPRREPAHEIIPALIRKPNFEMRSECEVTRINLDKTGKRATGVT